MTELLTHVIMPSVAVGVLYLVVIAVGAWIGDRFFGYQPRGYRDRFRSGQVKLVNARPTLLKDASAISWHAVAMAATAPGRYKRQLADSGVMPEDPEWLAAAMTKPGTQAIAAHIYKYEIFKDALGQEYMIRTDLETGEQARLLPQPNSPNSPNLPN